MFRAVFYYLTKLKSLSDISHISESSSPNSFTFIMYVLSAGVFAICAIPIFFNSFAQLLYAGSTVFSPLIISDL